MIATQTYNPFQSAFAELTSDRAQRFYAHKAQRDLQTTIDAALTVYCAAAAVAQFLVDFYTSYNAAAIPEVVETLGVVEEEILLLPAPAPKLLLPAETLAHSGRTATEERQLRQLCKAVLINAIEPLPSVREEPLITPKPKAKRGRKAKAKV
jgi:hypothetical protein